MRLASPRKMRGSPGRARSVSLADNPPTGDSLHVSCCPWNHIVTPAKNSGGGPFFPMNEAFRFIGDHGTPRDRGAGGTAP